MTTTVGEQLGKGGSLYQDGLPQFEPLPPESADETKEEKLRRKIMNKLMAAEAEAKKEEEKTKQEIKPHYTPPKPPKDWRPLQSTVLEIIGVILLSIGFGMLTPWLGVVVLGGFILLMGIAVGLPPGFTIRRPGRRE